MLWARASPEFPELRQELHQARLQVSHGSGLAEQQQRQLESDTVEPLPECLETLRMKAVSDPLHERSLVCKSSMPAAPEQTYGVCGPETSVADAGVEAARWEIPSPRDVSITDEDSSEESIGEETDRRRVVVKPIDLGRPPTGPGFQNWLAELYVSCCADWNRLKAVEKAPTHKTLEVCSRKWERFDAELAAACFRFASGEVLRKLKKCIEILFSGGVWMCLVVLLCGLSCKNMLSKLERFSRSDCQDSLDSLSLATLVSSWTA